MGFTHMEKDRQTGSVGYFQLLFEKLLLNASVKSHHMVIEADFTYRRNTSSCGQNLKFLQMASVVVRKIHGMQSRGGVESFLFPTKGDDALPAVPVDPRQDYFRHTGLSGSGKQLLEPLFEGDNIKVTMGINKFHGETSSAVDYKNGRMLPSCLRSEQALAALAHRYSGKVLDEALALAARISGC